MQVALRLVWCLVLLVTGGCASTPPLPDELPMLRLAPESFDGSVSLVQRLRFARLDGATVADQVIEAMLEIEPGEVRLAGFALGQRVLALSWNGHELHAGLHPRLPEGLDAGRVLRDVQFVYWPAAALSASLPSGWSLRDDGSQRTLLHAGRAVLIASYGGEPRLTGRAELENRIEGYRLMIESALQIGVSQP